MQDRYPGFVSLCKAKRRKDGKAEDGWPSTAIQIFSADVESALQTNVMARLGQDYPSVKDRILINCDALFIPNTIGLLPAEMLEILNGLHVTDGIRYTHKPMMQVVHIADVDLALQRVQGGPHAADQPQDEYSRWKTEFEVSRNLNLNSL
jgi:hypothetical protein